MPALPLPVPQRPPGSTLALQALLEATPEAWTAGRIHMAATILNYVRNELGVILPGHTRPGCPFAKQAVDRDRLTLLIREDIHTGQEAANALLPLLEPFARCVAEDRLQSLVLALPNIDAPADTTLEEATRPLIAASTRYAILIGLSAPGDLLGESNAPLSPVPILILRAFDIHDLAFLVTDQGFIPERVRAYLQLFGDDFEKGYVSDPVLLTLYQRVIAEL